MLVLNKAQMFMHCKYLYTELAKFDQDETLSDGGHIDKLAQSVCAAGAQQWRRALFVAPLSREDVAGSCRADNHRHSLWPHHGPTWKITTCFSIRTKHPNDFAMPSTYHFER